ncbi:class I SAM-dependent methyltransferase [Micrococcales bacterium 31B]|nr:class I SAM-dependent methyltransferase [Micrococcales bacterium 31B]
MKPHPPASAPNPRPRRFAGYSPAAHAESVAANRAFWDADATAYLADHGSDLGDAEFQWCPEGLQEGEARVLGIDYGADARALRGLRVLEVGAGAGQCSRWLTVRGVGAVATDLSHGMLAAGAALNRRTGHATPLVQCDGTVLPFADSTFDVSFSAYGVFPFVPDIGAVLRELRRVTRDGGRVAFSVTHPIRWAFADDPTEGGLTATRSYFDRAPYIETDASGALAYAEHHRTLGDYVRAIAAAGLTLDDLIEPLWPEGRDVVWGGWSKLRGERLPGTAIFVCGV